MSDQITLLEITDIGKEGIGFKFHGLKHFNDKWFSWAAISKAILHREDEIIIDQKCTMPNYKQLQSQVEQLQADNARLREAFDLTIDRSFWLLEKGSPAQWITHSEDYLKLIKQLGVDAPYIKSFDERSGIGMNKAWDFTGDAQKAIKFDSKEKADYFAKEERLFEHGVVAIEHVFMEMPATNEEKLNHIAKALASTDSSNWLAEQKAQWRREVLEEAADKFFDENDVEVNTEWVRDELRRMAEQPESNCACYPDDKDADKRQCNECPR